MKTYARVERKIVQELFTTDGNIKELFHPSMQWVDVTGLKQEPSEGWLYENGIFTKPLPLITF
ncbi:hypothetical protein [Pantoea agglomerans]|jgi:hypothetical protein|uniref:Uncharacterized protein n=1 Tax=Enterobacter agglomerans TaxID=549 RepID=A0ACC5PLJ3_ENTAG|nr:hypothetical protein [Pantoea agglomerans]MBD8125853.1 hypothetical protein [Pantoea agglomerans]NEH19235.1 hypothetical protein [Pantoea agglomerans]